MSRTNRIQINPGEVLGRLVDQAKEMTSKTGENITESISNKSLSLIDEHYAVTKNEKMDGVIELLKEQETKLNKLSASVVENDSRIGDMQEKLNKQESLLNKQVEVLKADNRVCATELKEIISGTNQMDYDALEGAFKETGEQLMSQQRAHTIEMDRMMMSLKTSLEKNIEKTKGVVEKKIEATSVLGKSMNKTTLILTIINLVCLIGYIIYDTFL